MRYALVVDGIVTNLILWDGVTEVVFTGEPILAPDDSGADIDGTWDGKVFGPAPVPEPPPPSDLELLVQVLIDKNVITKEEAGDINAAGSADALPFDPNP